MRTDVPAPGWTGRDDGPGPENLRWHNAVRPYTGEPGPGVVTIGFASDAGVVRNLGRPGAAAGPAALRAALAPLAVAEELHVEDAGDIVVEGDELEAGQARLAAAVAAALDAGRLPLVLGGGHEVAYGTYRGLAASARARGTRIAILNLDAHFDLRRAERPSSGTPFRQILAEAGDAVSYAVVGISEPSNTRALFDAAAEFGVAYLTDEQAQDARDVDRFVAGVLDAADVVYLTIDLDVLPAAVAPGVSAPAGFGVPLPIVAGVCRAVAAGGKLAVCDMAELNPVHDIDGRTARTGARLLHTVASSRP